MPFRPGDTGWGERASREAERKANFLPRLSLSPPPRCPWPRSAIPCRLGVRSPRAPDLIPGALRSFPYGRRPLAEGTRKVSDSRRPMAGGRGSPAPPRMAGGADRGGRYVQRLRWRTQARPSSASLEARSQAGLPGAAGRCALQGREWGRGSQFGSRRALYARGPSAWGDLMLLSQATRSAHNLSCL